MELSARAALAQLDEEYQVRRDDLMQRLAESTAAADDVRHDLLRCRANPPVFRRRPKTLAGSLRRADLDQRSAAKRCASCATVTNWHSRGYASIVALTIDTGAVSNGHTQTHFPRSLTVLAGHSQTRRTCLTSSNG